MRDLGPPDKEALERCHEGLRVEIPRDTWVSALFGDERATPAVPAFLQDTKLGEFVSLAALGGGTGVEGAEPAAERERRWGQAARRMYISFVFSWCTFFLF